MPVDSRQHDVIYLHYATPMLWVKAQDCDRMAVKKEIVSRTVEVMLRPVIRFCLQYSFKMKDFSECLKRAFVHAACAEIVRAGKAISVSRVHVMSGVNRIDVARILEGKERSPKTQDIVSKVVGQWRNDRNYLTASGMPRVLTAEGMESEFVTLVRSVSSDLNPYTVLFELERVGMAERTRNGVKLTGSVYIPTDLHEAFELMADDVDDLMRTVEGNVSLPSDDRALHIKTEYDNIPLEKVPLIQRWVRRQGSLFHRKIRDFLSSFDRDITPARGHSPGRARIAVGSFNRIDVISGIQDEIS